MSDVKKAMYMVIHAWNMVSDTTIKNRFRKCDIINRFARNYYKTSFNELFSLLKSFNLVEKK